MQPLKAAFSYSDRNWQCLFSIGRSDEQFFLRLLIVESALELVKLSNCYDCSINLTYTQSLCNTQCILYKIIQYN